MLSKTGHLMTDCEWRAFVEQKRLEAELIEKGAARLIGQTGYVPGPRIRTRFVEPMLLLKTERLPDDSTRWLYQLKVDGFRAIAFKSHNKVYIRSRNDKDFASRYPSIAKALSALPDETMIDGEIVAFD